MVRTRSVGTRIRPTCVSRPSILTFRANFSRTWSSLLLATRRTKNCMATFEWTLPSLLACPDDRPGNGRDHSNRHDDIQSYLPNLTQLRTHPVPDGSVE